MPPTSSVMPQMTAIDQERDAGPGDHDDAADHEQDPERRPPTLASRRAAHPRSSRPARRRSGTRPTMIAIVVAPAATLNSITIPKPSEDEADRRGPPTTPCATSPHGVRQCRIFTVDAHGLPLRRRERTGGARGGYTRRTSDTAFRLAVASSRRPRSCAPTMSWIPRPAPADDHPCERRWRRAWRR